VYLRALGEPVRRQAGLDPAQLFPLLTLENLGPLRQMLIVELIRELATLAMLAAAALAVARSIGTWLAGFAIAFGAWDLSFYVFLKLLIDWPASLLTWDLLFLLPAPWAGPVLAPVIVAVSLVVCGWIALQRDMRAKRLEWVGLVAGGLIIITSFMFDTRSLMAGKTPESFPWWLFALGEAMGIAAFLRALQRHTTQSLR
jgi:hypothetical protein